MCGIFGAVNTNGPVDPRITRILADHMFYRGPDDEGVHVSYNWAIGMRRLSIIDVEGGHQPISNENGTLFLVCNGEIYNYLELRVELEGRGHQFKTKSDVEVLLHLYEDYGFEAIHRLNGMFAFALYDMCNQRLWIARDRLGIKPLYFSSGPSEFIFSSELSGLAAALNARFARQSIVDYLGYSYIPAPQTAYEGISKLRPGEELILTSRGLEQRLYWQPKVQGSWHGSLMQAKEELDGLLVDAIKLQLISDVPLGVLLSGGVDSSAIASYAAGLGGGIPLRTFTIDFVGKNGNDAAYAEILSNSLGTHHTLVKVTAEDQFNALGELIAGMDEPMSDSAIVPTYIISRAARAEGVKVLLSGAGGDEIFGGYPRHFPGRVYSSAWFATLSPLLRRTAAFGLGLANPALKIRLATAARNFAVNISGVNFQFLSAALRSEDEYSRLLHKIDRDFSEAISKQAYPLMMMDVVNYLPNNILALTDKATMAASVEGRVPLLDHRIVEFAFSIPEELNLLHGGQKGLFKQVLRNRLPAKLLDREKEGFNAPIHDWVQRWPRRLRDELIGSFSPELEEIVDRRVVEKWLGDERMRRMGGASLYAVYVMNKWLNNHKTLVD